MKAEIDSKEELYYTWWLEDLQSKDIIKNFEKGRTYDLSNKFDIHYIKELKSKSKEETQSIMHDHKYSPDFEIHFNYSNEYINKLLHVYDVTCPKTSKWTNEPLLVNSIGMPNRSVIVEIKPSFDANNMTRLFRLNQKWMMDKYDIYVNEVEIAKLFESTFTPSRYLYTDKGNQLRQINKWKVISVDEYLNK